MAESQDKTKNNLQSLYYAIGVIALLVSIITSFAIGYNTIGENKKEIMELKRERSFDNSLLLEIRFNLRTLMNANGQQYIENPVNGK